VWVENRSDELWLGVKGQSNLRIAGSLRNSFRASLELIVYGGRATEEDEGASRLLPLIKLRIPYAEPRESVYGG
jgi:hypothetical protein